MQRDPDTVHGTQFHSHRCLVPLNAAAVPAYIRRTVKPLLSSISLLMTYLLTGCGPGTVVCDEGSVEFEGRCVLADASMDTRLPDGTPSDVGLDSDAARTCADGCEGETPHCDSDSDRCVMCTEPVHCTEPTAAACVGGSCTRCSVDADCAGTGENVCIEGECVECGPQKEIACGAQVCDLSGQRCSSIRMLSAGVCETCVSDRQCRDGLACVDWQVDGIDVGLHCMWKDDAPTVAGDCANVQPYTEVASAMSVSLFNVDYCRPALTTCAAFADHGVRTCSNALTDCGVSGTSDSLCTVDTMTCAVPCRADGDCRAPQTCLRTTTPFRCSF